MIPPTSFRLAGSATRRLLFSCAISLYRYAADADDAAERNIAAEELPGLLAKRGDLDELRAWPCQPQLAPRFSFDLAPRSVARG